MDLFKEIDEFNELLLFDKSPKLDSDIEGYEDLQSKYSSLHETYSKEIENSKKVEKCLVKCLKFYSKLCKKYEVQQKVIVDLEESIKEKINSLEEAQRNEVKLKGLIQVYRTERTLYAGQTNAQLRKDKELLLEICCKLIGDSVRSNNTRSLTNLLLRKFKNDLDDEKLNMLKGKGVKLKDELDFGGDLKPDVTTFKNEMEFKSEDKYSNEMTKVEVKEQREDTKNHPLDLSFSKVVEEEQQQEETSCVVSKESNPGCDTENERQENWPELENCSDSLFENEDKSGNLFEKENNSGNLYEGEEKLVISFEKEDKSGSLFENENNSSNLYEGEEKLVISFEKEDKSGSLFENENNSDNLYEGEEKLGISFEKEDKSGSLFENENNSGNLHEGEEKLGNSFEKEDKLEERCTANNQNKVNVDIVDSEDESDFPYESELSKIFREMSSVRLLSPLRESNNSPIAYNKNEIAQNVKIGNENYENENSGTGLKRNSDMGENSCKSKKFKPEPDRQNGSLLDSIMSAMSLQNEEFKSNGFAKKESDTSTEAGGRSPSRFRNLGTRTYSRVRKLGSGCSRERTVVCQKSGGERPQQQTVEKLVAEEIKNFVSSPISTKEDADKNVKHCVSVLTNKSEDVIAKCIVALVLENVDEAVEIFERPAPPLTKTQHRLIVLLSVFQSLDPSSEKISNKILSLISEKLFPDNFFWPDDSIEAVIRFYAALCRSRNDPKTLWRFCLNAMTEMRQRCPLLMFTVLKTWPDVLHDASTLKNNILAVTIVNIFLHMSKTEGLRNFNQGRKLMALKHLLLNFYQFKVEDTIEGYATKVLNAVCREELGSEKSIVLLAKCRDHSWTAKNLVPALKSRLVDWFEGKLEDSAASRILSVMKQICPLLTKDMGNRPKVKDIVSCLSDILTSRKKSHDSEVSVIEVLLQLKQYPEVRRVIREWIPKNPIQDGLRNEIVEASAENILRELKLNRKKDPRSFSARKKLKKESKKSKGKKKKAKKRKKSDISKAKETKAESASVSS